MCNVNFEPILHIRCANLDAVYSKALVYFGGNRIKLGNHSFQAVVPPLMRGENQTNDNAPQDQPKEDVQRMMNKSATSKSGSAGIHNPDTQLQGAQNVGQSLKVKYTSMLGGVVAQW
jgi:hypothetical protein